MEKHFIQNICFTYYGKRKINENKSVLLPPPNTTGALHIGHALSSTLQDVLIRFWKMMGYNVKWQLGTDHAGIATAIMVRKFLKEKNIVCATEQELIDYTKHFVKVHQEVIYNQMKEMGFDVYDDFRYTMDDAYSQKVQEAFHTLKEAGLIIQDKRLINWDTIEQTAISDLEVSYEKTNSQLYYIKYMLTDQTYVIVATTRPETIFADQALAVNPHGKFKGLIGKTAIVPIIHKHIPIIGDEYAQDNFGSGIVKITPAHDFNDFKISKMHNLELYNILEVNGTLNVNTPSQYCGRTILEARAKIITELDIIKIETIENTIPISTRTGAVIEPLVSTQWFMNMTDLSQNALNNIHKTSFNHNWGNVYKDWLLKIEPWCISRQIAWGHKIPESKDVLDTWFSSALWAIYSMNIEEMKEFYPFTILITGHDIVFFWVARMCMLSLYFTHQVPFKNVLLHPLVLDKYGQKMSKTKGNVIDPRDMVATYGSDALRLTLCNLSCAIYSVRFDDTHIKGYKNLITKLWNSARCIFHMRIMWSTEYIQPIHEIDIWMVNKILKLSKEYIHNMNSFIYNTDQLISVFRNDFCDIYLECAKIIKLPCIAWVFSSLISMFYPFTPFVACSIMQELHGTDFVIPEVNTELTQYISSFDDLVVLLRKVCRLNSLYTYQYRIATTCTELQSYIPCIEKFLGNKIQIEYSKVLNGLSINSGKYFLTTDISNIELLISNQNDLISKIDKIMNLFENKLFLENANEEVKKQKIATLNVLLDNLYEVLSLNFNEDYSVFEQYKKRVNDICISVGWWGIK